MAGRGKVSLYMVFLFMTFGTIGLISFQTIKERKNSAILLVAKYKEIDDLNNRYEELLEATKKSLLQAKEEKDLLTRNVKDLENNDKIHHTMCKENKEKYKVKKDQEITTLKEKLQAKDLELTKTKAKVEVLKLNNKKADAKMVIKTVGKDDLLDEGLESFVKISNIKNKNSKISLLQSTAKAENETTDVGRIVESNIKGETKVEDAKVDTDFKVDKTNRANLEENSESIATKVVEEEDDDAKELEVDMKLNDFDVGETDESQIHE